MESFIKFGLSGTNLTLWGFLENPRTFEIQSGQEKRALEGSFSKNGGLFASLFELSGKRKIYLDTKNCVFFATFGLKNIA